MDDDVFTMTGARVVGRANARATGRTKRRALPGITRRMRVHAMATGLAALTVAALTAGAAGAAGAGDATGGRDLGRGGPLQWVAGADTPGDALDVSIAGSYAYVADREGGLQVIDIGNPEDPQLVGNMETPSEALDGHVSGGHVYVATRADGLVVADLSTPTSPMIVGSVPTTGSAIGLVVSGQYAYVADRESGLQVVDVSDPSFPVIVGTADTPYRATDVAVAGSIAYVADVLGGLQIIDVSVPTNPMIIAAEPTVRAIGVAVSDTVAYVIGDGLHTIDVGNPALPQVLGSAPTFDVDPRDVTVDGRYVYLVDSVHGLQVVDVIEPASPLIFAELATDGSASGVVISDTFAFVADGEAGLEVIDVTPLTLIVTDGPGGAPGATSPSIVGTPFPRPAGHLVTTRLRLDAATDVRVTLYDVAGRRLETILDRRLSAGTHAVKWARGTVPPGVYVLRVDLGGRTATRRVVLAP